MKTPKDVDKLWNKYCHEGDENTPDRMFYENFVDAITEAIAEAEEDIDLLTEEMARLREDVENARAEGRQAGIDEAVEKIEKEIENKLETWAALEHSRWSKWQEYLHSKLYEIDDRRVSANNHLKILPTELWQRWERQIMTPYSDLSEAEKESDREQVRPYIEDIKRTIKALQDNK